jgi:predicted nuclease of predicted toxin-antitoxin system
LRLFIDECLSPRLAQSLNATGDHDAVHPRDRGRLGEPDHLILARCVAEDRVIVTENAIDFRKLAARVKRHPGLIVLPSVARDASLGLLVAALHHLAMLGDPADVMIDHVLEVSKSGNFTLSALPPAP